MRRKEIVRALQRLAFAAEMKGDRRARAWSGAAWALRQSDEDLHLLAQEGRLTELKGVGRSTAALVADLLDDLRPALLDELEADLPAGLFELRKVKGLGPKKVKALWEALGVASLAELEQACRENRLVELKGFGAKTQQKVLAEIARLRESAGKRRRDQAWALVRPVLRALREHGRAEVGGALRRGMELVEAMPIVTTAPPDAAAATGAGSAGAGSAGAGSTDEGAADAVERVHVRPGAFGWALLQRSASEAHLEALRARAAERGVELEALEAEREEDVYDALGLAPTPPERREPGVPLVTAGKARTPLVRREDLRGALHNHTTASDGAHTLRQMRDAAAAGLSYLGISEHSVSAFYARGLDVERLRAQREAIAELNAEGSACTLLTGVESDILEDGALDYADDVLAELEVVVASVHRRYAQDREAATRRLANAARHPRAAVLGHPTGRLLLGRAPTDVDMAAVLDACVEGGCAVELNANPARLDLSAAHLAMAKARGVPVSIAADAHSMGELANLEHGVAVARRAGLTAEDVLNARPLDALRRWLASRAS